MQNEKPVSTPLPINFKKWVMTFKNQDIRVIAPMDPQEGCRYIDPIKDEIGRG